MEHRIIVSAVVVGLPRTPVTAAIQDADLGAFTPDKTAAAHAPTIAVIWRQTNQRGDLLSVEHTSSGNCATSVLESTLPTPGAERSSRRTLATREYCE
jgi:hypothetical protein